MEDSFYTHEMTSAKVLYHIPDDMAEDVESYVSLPGNHYSVKFATEKMKMVADAIESCISPREPYEISVVGLKTSGQSIRPVMLIGTQRPDRLTEVLINLSLVFQTRVRECYPASLSNNVDRSTQSSQKSMMHQKDTPHIGLSCGAMVDDRHSASIGAYIVISSLPKDICILTVPPTHLPLPEGATISQPSIADREQKHLLTDLSGVIVDVDPLQATALLARRQELENTFEFAKVVGCSNFPFSSPTDTSDTPETTLASTLTDVNDAITPQASVTWAVAQVTRRTTVQSVSEKKRKIAHPFRSLKPTPVCHPKPNMTVSKTGRTTAGTIGTVNGVKSIYRLPRDGQGVRRSDYIVLSDRWGGVFGYPGDAGAIVMAHAPEDIETDRIVRQGEPCGMVVAASSSGLYTFIESLVDVMADIESQGLGRVTIIPAPED